MSPTNEVADKWGISRARVITLAKTGRIPGVTRIANNWMIPEDATKPLDKRFKDNNIDESKYEYRFPLFLFGRFPDETLAETLSSDEKILLEAQLAYCRCEYDYCVEILSDIVDSISNIYTRIGALYILCLSSIASDNRDCFTSSFAKLNSIFSGDFPYKKDFSFLFYDIKIMYQGNDIILDDYDIDLEYEYLTDMLPHHLLQTAYVELILSLNNQTTYPLHLELLCNNYEQNGYIIVALRLHIYIGLLYSRLQNEKKAYYHLGKAVELAVQYELYDLVPAFYAYKQDIFDKVLDNYNPEIRDKIQLICMSYQNNLISFFGSNAEFIKDVLSLTQEEHMLMAYAHKNLSNKEIAELMGITEYSVRKKYQTLLDKFNITNKRNLGEYYLYIIAKGHQ